MKDNIFQDFLQEENDKIWKKCSRPPLELPTLFRQNGRFMATFFAPTRQHVERYRRFRALSMELNHRIIKTIPRQAYDEIGNALGIRHNGILVFNSEDMTNVMMDCCLYDWYENGKNIIQRYAQTHPATPATEAGYLLEACLHAKYRIVVVQSVVPGAGFHCRDVLNGGELFLMDLAFSQSLPGGGATLATRTIPLGEFWMTAGAALPIDSETDIEGALQWIESDCGKPLEGTAIIALSIVRACLAAGAADRITYAASPTRRKSRREPRWSGFKQRRR